MATEKAELQRLKAELGMMGDELHNSKIESPEELMAAMNSGAYSMSKACTPEEAKLAPTGSTPWKVYIGGPDRKVIVFSEGENDVVGYLSARKAVRAAAVTRKSVVMPMGGDARRPPLLECMPGVPLDAAILTEIGIPTLVLEGLTVPEDIAEEMIVVAEMANGDQDPGSRSTLDRL
jgi:hypothetical protein